MRSGARNTVISLCVAMGVLEGYDIQIIGVTAPALISDFGLSPGDLAWLFFISNAGMLVGAVVGGWLADRHGRRPVLIASAVIFASCTLGTALAQSLHALLWLRLLAGFGLGAGLPNLVATAADITAPGRRGLVTGLMFCGVPVGGATVALLSRVDPELIGWRELFALGGTLPLFVALLLWIWLPETRPSKSAIQVRVPFSSLFEQGNWRPTILLWLTIAPTLLALYLVLYWLPTLVVAKGLSRDVAAQASAAFNLAGAMGAVAIGTLADRSRGPHALVGVYVAFVVVVLLLAPSDTPAQAIGLSAIAGFLLLGVNYAAYGFAGSLYPAPIRGTGSGAAVGAGRIGSIIGPLLPGLLLSRGAGPTAVIWALIPAALIAGFALLCLAPRLSRERAGTDRYVLGVPT